MDMWLLNCYGQNVHSALCTYLFSYFRGIPGQVPQKLGQVASRKICTHTHKFLFIFKTLVPGRVHYRQQSLLLVFSAYYIVCRPNCFGTRSSFSVAPSNSKIIKFLRIQRKEFHRFSKFTSHCILFIRTSIQYYSPCSATKDAFAVKSHVTWDGFFFLQYYFHTACLRGEYHGQQHNVIYSQESFVSPTITLIVVSSS